MVIYRTDNQMRQCLHYAKTYDIHLTPKEVLDTYHEQDLEFKAQDIAEDISQRIEDAVFENWIEPEAFDEDWPMRVGRQYTRNLEEQMEWRIREIYLEAVHEVVTEALEELGYDPETMKREQ